MSDAQEGQLTSEAQAAMMEQTPPRGLIRLSELALEQVRQFQTVLQARDPKADLVMCILCGPRAVAESIDSPWEDLGDGLTVGGYYRHQVPPDAVETINGVELVFVIPSAERNRFVGKLIDYKPGQGFFLIDG